VAQRCRGQGGGAGAVTSRHTPPPPNHNHNQLSPPIRNEALADLKPLPNTHLHHSCSAIKRYTPAQLLCYKPHPPTASVPLNPLAAAATAAAAAAAAGCGCGGDGAITITNGVGNGGVWVWVCWRIYIPYTNLVLCVFSPGLGLRPLPCSTAVLCGRALTGPATPQQPCHADCWPSGSLAQTEAAAAEARARSGSSSSSNSHTDGHRGRYVLASIH